MWRLGERKCGGWVSASCGGWVSASVVAGWVQVWWLGECKCGGWVSASVVAGWPGGTSLSARASTTTCPTAYAMHVCGEAQQCSYPHLPPHTHIHTPGADRETRQQTPACYSRLEALYTPRTPPPPPVQRGGYYCHHCCCSQAAAAVASPAAVPSRLARLPPPRQPLQPGRCLAQLVGRPGAFGSRRLGGWKRTPAPEPEGTRVSRGPRLTVPQALRCGRMRHWGRAPVPVPGMKWLVVGTGPAERGPSRWRLPGWAAGTGWMEGGGRRRRRQTFRPRSR